MESAGLYAVLERRLSGGARGDSRIRADTSVRTESARFRGRHPFLVREVRGSRGELQRGAGEVTLLSEQRRFLQSGVVEIPGRRQSRRRGVVLQISGSTQANERSIASSVRLRLAVPHRAGEGSAKYSHGGYAEGFAAFRARGTRRADGAVGSDGGQSRRSREGRGCRREFGRHAFGPDPAVCGLALGFRGGMDGAGAKRSGRAATGRNPADGPRLRADSG